MSEEAEAKILEPFKARAEKGELIEVSEIARAYKRKWIIRSAADKSTASFSSSGIRIPYR